MSKPTDELFACLYGKDFPAQAMLRLRPELRGKPCVVMAGEPPMQQVCSLNAQARKLGVMQGMMRVEVDIFSSVAVLQRSLAEETAAKEALLECAGAFSPRVEDQSTDNSFLCVMDIAGTEKLLGPVHALGRTLLQRVRALGFHASVAVSSNFHAALCMARGMSATNHVTVIPTGDEQTSLAPLRLAVLQLSATHDDVFSLWGIRTLGMLAELPQNALTARIGQEGKRLRELARGELPHLFRPMEPVFSLVERMDLGTPVELLDSLMLVIDRMLEQLIVRATARIVALASVTVTLSLEGGALHTRTVRPALATTYKQLWAKLIHLDLAAHPPQAEIFAIELVAESGKTGKVQLGLFSPQLPEPMRLDVTLARIRAIVGEDRVGSARLNDTHRPDGFRMEPFIVASRSSSQALPLQSRKAVRQIRPAESIRITLRGKQPDRFSFRDKWYVVEFAYGPWLASGDWWNPGLWSNEQWDLGARADNGQSDGAMLHCCILHDLAKDCWQVVSLYD